MRISEGLRWRIPFSFIKTSLKIMKMVGGKIMFVPNFEELHTLITELADEQARLKNESDNIHKHISLHRVIVHKMSGN